LQSANCMSHQVGCREASTKSNKRPGEAKRQLRADVVSGESK
jgi:hypothetical protein